MDRQSLQRGGTGDPATPRRDAAACTIPRDTGRKAAKLAAWGAVMAPPNRRPGESGPPAPLAPRPALKAAPRPEGRQT